MLFKGQEYTAVCLYRAAWVLAKAVTAIGAQSERQATHTLLIMSWDVFVIIIITVIVIVITVIITVMIIGESQAAAAHHATGAHLLCSDTWHHSED